MGEIQEEKELLQSDLEIINILRHSLSPMPTYNLYPYTIHTYYKMMESVGGDVVDVYSTETGHHAVFVADVSGHGLLAALIASMVKIWFREKLKSTKSPREIFAYINKQLINIVTTGDYVTAFIIILDEKGNAIYGRAAHPEAIIIRENGASELWHTSGSMLGFSKTAAYFEKQDILQAGDRIIIYTDGLAEMRNKNNDFFSRDKIISLAKQYQKQTGEKFHDAIKSCIEEFSTNIENADDISFLILDKQLINKGENSYEYRNDNA